MTWTITGMTEDLTNDAAAAQKVVKVTDATKFHVHASVYIQDDDVGDNEVNEIDAIDTTPTPHEITMVNDLAHSYEVAKNAKLTIGIVESITLPKDPKDISCGGPAEMKAGPHPGYGPLLISIGKKVRALTLQGWIAEPGKTKADLETEVVLPLEALKHELVTVDAPDTRYDGIWLLYDFTFQEPKGYATSFPYKMILWQGKKYVIL